MRADVVRSDVPFRLDRLPWSRWHWTIVIGLGITWVLDGLEVTVVGNLAPTLKTAAGLNLSDTQFTDAASGYLIGAALGALVFGALADRFGRKRLFLVTLGWYLTLTVATAFSWDAHSFTIFRVLTGFGLGGEYAAINSAIDELIPARRRGVVDLAINGTWWLGTIVASLGSLVLLNPHVVPAAIGWRLAFALGAILALAVLSVRRSLPESPRWLLTHGRAGEADRTLGAIEAEIERERHAPLPPPDGRTIAIDQRHRAGIGAVVRTMFETYPRRTAVALALMCAQAFIYNAFTFTQGLILNTYFHVAAGAVPLYFLPFAIGNLAGPLVLGNLFDTVGRKPMIALTYGVSGVLLLATGAAFAGGLLDATTITLCWMSVFFFASAGASAAYLTAGELFPMESRALAIAIVYAIGTLVGGAFAPAFFGRLIAGGSVPNIVFGYVVAAGVMFAGGATAWFFGIAAERRGLEDIAVPLSARV